MRLKWDLSVKRSALSCPPSSLSPPCARQRIHFLHSCLKFTVCSEQLIYNNSQSGQRTRTRTESFLRLQYMWSIVAGVSHKSVICCRLAAHCVCVCDIIAFKVLDRGGTPSIQLVTQTDSGEIDSHKHTQSLRPGDPSPADCPALFITGSEWRGEVGARWWGRGGGRWRGEVGGSSTTDM